MGRDSETTRSGRDRGEGVGGVATDAEDGPNADPSEEADPDEAVREEVDLDEDDPDDDSDDPDDPDDPDDDGEEEASDWFSRTWYRSRGGVAIVAFDVVLAAWIAYLTATDALAGNDLDLAVDLEGIAVPWHVYAFAVLGALGYVFTALVDEYDRSTGDLLRYNTRLAAAIPLGAGIFLLSDLVLGGSGGEALVLGTVFLGGLYVNLAYRQFHALADRLLGDDEDDTDAGQDAGSEDEARVDAPDASPDREADANAAGSDGSIDADGRRGG